MSSVLLWNTEHASMLVTLCQEKGLDAYQLSKLSCLSPQQVQELEGLASDAQRSTFYSPAIKAHAGHRLMDMLRSLPDAPH